MDPSQLPPPSQGGWSTPLILVFFFVVLHLLSKFVLYKRVIRPPGPKGQFIFGNVFQVPKTKVWKYFEALGKEYGPIIRLSMGRDEIIVLNDPQDAEELLGKRSQNYSSRKSLVFAGKYQSHNKRIVLLPYGAELKRQRTAFNQMLQPRYVASYDNIQSLESTKLLHDMLTSPDESRLNLERYSVSVAFTLCYGRRIRDEDDDVTIVLDILRDFIRNCYPGSHLVDTFPILDKLPNWLAPWRAEAVKKYDFAFYHFSRLVREVKTRMDKGDLRHDCFSSRLWSQMESLDLDFESLAFLVGSTFEAGTDTTSATMLWFLLAAILHPDKIKKAQVEIDTVCGSDGKTLPSFDNMASLPYSIALTKEVLRWMPAAPGGFPHLSDKTDTYKQFTIPARTQVIPNIWAMQHNERLFPDPLSFNPERFLRSSPSSIPDNMTEGHYGFGFGRRACPAKNLAVKTVWIGITRMIWAFDISHDIDPDGRPIPVDPELCSSGITSRPDPFRVRIIPRSLQHSETIRREWSNITEGPI